MTMGCRGCEAANRGVSGVAHNERCRLRVETAISERDPDRYCRALERLTSNAIKRKTAEEDSPMRDGGDAEKGNRDGQPEKRSRTAIGAEIHPSEAGDAGRHLPTDVMKELRPCLVDSPVQL